MNFSGWVAIPRTILNNTHTGQLSNTEQLVLLTLILLADAKTGSGYINAAAIRAYLPELKYDTAKRVLKSLEDKHLIYRRIRHASNALYPYWLHGYQISSGPHKPLWTNLSQVFVTNEVSAIRYDLDAPAMPLATTPATPPAIPPAGVPNNNKDHDKDTNKDNLLGSMRGEKKSSIRGERESDERSETKGERRGESEVTMRCVDGESKSESVNAPPFGLILKDGAYYTDTGVKVHPNALETLLGKEEPV